MSIVNLDGALTADEFDDLVEKFESNPDAAVTNANFEKLLVSLSEAYALVYADEVYAVDGEMPATIGACADELHDVRDVRLLLKKLTEQVERREGAVKEHIIQNLSSSDDTGAAGKRYRVQIKKDEKPRPDDWQQIYAWIKDNDRFDLLQKRLSDNAVMAVLENEDIPGMDKMWVPKVSLTKI